MSIIRYRESNCLIRRVQSYSRLYLLLRRCVLSGLFLCGFIFLHPEGAQAQDHGAGEVVTDSNPAAPGFNADGSDAKAVAIADRVMKAMGGRRAWDEARYLSWKFFGSRHHLWDKKTGVVRIEMADDKGNTTIWLMNINTKKGRVLLGDNSESTDIKALEQGYGAWVNDAYWLFMPYKLGSSGNRVRSEERRVGKECRSRWSPYH